jgi:transcriptional regulator with XRE-family HTH domain
MTSDHVSDVAARRLREFRRSRGLTAQDLAANCKEFGAAQITAAVIANIETGRRDADGNRRRDLTVDELLVFACVLDVRPYDLLETDDSEEVSITRFRQARTRDVAAWMRGEIETPIIIQILDGFACCGSCGHPVRTRRDDNFSNYRCMNSNCTKPANRPASDVDDYVAQRVFSIAESAAGQDSLSGLREEWPTFPPYRRQQMIRALIASIVISQESTRIKWAWDQ